MAAALRDNSLEVVHRQPRLDVETSAVPHGDLLTIG